MMLSTKGKYGLKAVLDLAMHTEEGAIPLSTIAERQNISMNYLEQIIPKLKKAGISTIEIDLSKQKKILTSEELTQILLDNNDLKSWKYSALAQKILQRFYRMQQYNTPFSVQT